MRDVATGVGACAVLSADRTANLAPVGTYYLAQLTLVCA